MTADPEAVTRALHALYHRKKADRECQYANPERCHIYVEASRDASVLASLPDDRLAEAEAKVRRVEAKLEEWGHDPECESLTCLKGDGSTREPADCDCYYAEFRAALSGGDATRVLDPDPDTPTTDTDTGSGQ